MTLSNCDKKSQQKDHIRDHILKEHLKIYEVSGDKKKLPLELKQQLRELITRICMICKKELVFMENMTNHIKDNHPSEYNLPKIVKRYGGKREKPYTKSDNIKIVRRYNCKDCDYSNDLRVLVKMHMMHIHLKTRFKCQKCEFEKTNLNQILKHDKDNHESTLAFTSVCHKCQYQTDDPDLFKEHIETVHCSYLERKRKFRKNKRQNIKTRKIKDSSEKIKMTKSELKETGQMSEPLQKSDINIRKIRKVAQKAELKELSPKNCDPMKRKMRCRKAEVKKRILGGKYSCRDCQYSNDTKHGVKNHIIKAHMNSQFNCKKCTFEYHYLTILTHIKTEHNNDSSMILSHCGSCDKYFEDFQQFKDHAEIVHCYYLGIPSKRIRRLQNDTDKIDGEMMFKCSNGECDFVSSKAYVRIHIMLRHMKTRFTCNLCKVDFNNVNLASKHSKRVHNNDASALKSYCGSCDLTSDDFIAFDRHTMSVHCSHLTQQTLKDKQTELRNILN